MTLIINDMYDNLIQISDLGKAIEQVEGYVTFLKNDENSERGIDLDGVGYWEDIYNKLTQIASL